MVGSSVGMATSFFVIAGLYANLPPADDPSSKPIGIAMVSFVFIFFAFFTGGWLGPCFTFAAEILPLKGRTAGMSFGTGKRNQKISIL